MEGTPSDVKTTMEGTPSVVKTTTEETPSVAKTTMEETPSEVPLVTLTAELGLENLVEVINDLKTKLSRQTTVLTIFNRRLKESDKETEVFLHMFVEKLTT